MNVHPIRRSLRALLPGSAAKSRPLVVQHVGFECADLDTLPAVLDEVGRELGLSLTLDGVSGDLVLAEQGFVARVAPQVLHAFLDQRPLVTVAGAKPDEHDARRRVQRLHADLVQQFGAWSRQGHSTHGAELAGTDPNPAVPGFDFDSQFDTRQHAERLIDAELDPDRAELLNRLRRGLIDPAQPVLEAGYGVRAALAIDFATGVACLDGEADHCLRVRRELPYRARGARPGVDCTQRELDRVVWDIAVAAGGFRLLHSPISWWHTPLIAARSLNVSRYTQLPQHLEMARCLAGTPVSPSELRRRCRVSLSDLRGFLQACLFLGLVHWVPPTSA